MYNCINDTSESLHTHTQSHTEAPFHPRTSQHKLAKKFHTLKPEHIVIVGLINPTPPPLELRVVEAADITTLGYAVVDVLAGNDIAVFVLDDVLGSPPQHNGHTSRHPNDDDDEQRE